MRILVLSSLLLLVAPAYADQAPTLVPGLPLKAAPAAPQDAPLADAQRSAPATLTAAEIQALKASVDSTLGAVERKVPPSDAVTPPPPRVTARPGVNEVLPIGINRINRIRTTFASPQVKTVADATISTEGSIVYVASSSPEPVALFVIDAGAPERALSLTLLPRDLPPVDVEVRLEGDDEVQAPVARAQAQAWEMEQPYVETISDVMKALALGEVPRGYGLSEKMPAGDLPHCRWPGIQLIPGQRLDGANLVAFVMRVVNRSGATISLEEAHCEDTDVLAVAAWPHVELAPGAQTELFVVRRRSSDTAPSRRRPSTLTLAGER